MDIPILFSSIEYHNGFVEKISVLNINKSLSKSTRIIANSPSNFFIKLFPYFSYNGIKHSPSEL